MVGIFTSDNGNSDQILHSDAVYTKLPIALSHIGS